MSVGVTETRTMLRGIAQIRTLAPVLVGLLLVLVVLVGLLSAETGKTVMMSLPLPLEPAEHPRLRAITRVPRGHGAKDAVDFGALPTVSSRVVTNRLVDSSVVAKILAQQQQRAGHSTSPASKPKLGFSF